MKIQIGTEVRDMTQEEADAHALAFAELKLLQEQKDAAKQAVLDRLGLTAEEARLLLS